MAIAAFLGLMLGVAALVISLALLAGFQAHVRGRLLAETPHLVVTPAGRPPFGAADRLAERLALVAGVRSVAPVARGRIWVTRHGQAVPVEGVGREGVASLRLDAGQARQLNVFLGDEVMLVSSRVRLSPLGPVPIVASLPVKEFIPASTGRRAPESELPLADARRLFALGPDGATGYEVRLADPNQAGAVGQAIQHDFGPGVTTTTWEEANRSLVLALRLERIVLFATVFLIVIVAGLNLAATSAVLAATRAGDAATLAVLGASPGTIASIFRTAGALIGAAGTLLGIAVGAGLASVLDKTGIIPLPAQLYSLTHVPFRVDGKDLLIVAVLSLSWSVIAASLPARAAARMDVAEILRAA